MADNYNEKQQGYRKYLASRPKPPRDYASMSGFDPRRFVEMAREMQTADRAGQFVGGVQDFTQTTGDYLRAAAQNQAPTAPTGQRRGRGVSGSVGPKFDAGGLMATLHKLVQSGAYAAPQQTYTRDDALFNRLGEAVSADRGNTDAAFTALDEYLAGLGPNAWRSAARAEAPQADMSLLNLLSSQGVDPAAYRAEAELLQRQGSQGADAYNRMLDSLASVEDQSRQSRGLESQQARAFAGQQLDAESRALEMALDLREQARRRQIEDQNFARSSEAQAGKLQLIQQLAQLAAQYGLPQPSLEGLL